MVLTAHRGRTDLASLAQSLYTLHPHYNMNPRSTEYVRYMHKHEWYMHTWAIIMRALKRNAQLLVQAICDGISLVYKYNTDVKPVLQTVLYATSYCTCSAN